MANGNTATLVRLLHDRCNLSSLCYVHVYGYH